MFEMANMGDQRQHRFDNNSFTPRFMSTKYEVTRLFVGFLETKITQDNRCFIKLVSDWTKGLIMDVGSVPVPSNDLASVIDQPAPLNADDPALIGLTLFAHLLFAPSFTHGMDQFNTVSVNHRKKGGICQQALR